MNRSTAPNFNDEIYLMVTNGLTALDGTAADCRQEIQLDFGTSKSPYPIQQSQRLNPDTGQNRLHPSGGNPREEAGGAEN